MGRLGVGVAVSVGGLYGINVETLSADKTLTANTDKIYQYLYDSGNNRIITLDTASATAGDRFVIRHNGDYNSIRRMQIKQGAGLLDTIYAGTVKEFIFDGTNWIAGENTTGEQNTKALNIAVGYGAKAYTSGVAIGNVADANNYGVAVGYSAHGYNRGVGIGRSARGYDYGVAIGYYAQTNAKRYSIAFGYYSETERVGETSTNIDGLTTQKNNVIQGRWSLTTTNNTPAEMFCAAYGTNRFTIRATSALAFKMAVVARDNVANEVAMYTFEGLIKRDASNNTVMSVINKAIIYEDDVTWDVAVTADDTNESLKIEVTGDASNPTQWAVRMDGVETHF